MGFGAFVGAMVSVVPAAIAGTVVAGITCSVTMGAVEIITGACDVEKETADNMAHTAGGAAGLGAGVWTTCKIIGAVYSALDD